METVPDLFESISVRHGALSAVIDNEGALRYEELNARANRLARRLIASGVRPDSVVAVAVPKSNDLIIAIMAVLKAGGAYLPLDPAYPVERLSFMLSDARPALLVRTSSVAVLEAGLPEIVLDQPDVLQACALLPDHNIVQHERRAPLRPEHLMYVIYTSGSTGSPKGVAVPHSGVSDMVATQAAVLGAGPGDRVLQWASMSFDAAFWDVSLALLSGATLVMAAAEDLLPGEPLRDTLLKYDVTHAVLPPVALSETDADDVLVGGTVMSTGDSCTPTLVRKWAHGRRMYNGYGPTEVTVGATIGGPIRHAEAVAIGAPWIGNEIYVLDEQLRSVASGTEGELYISGSGLARGYLNRSAATATKFVADPFGPPGSRMYRTGDRGYAAPNGEFHFAGRVDGQVKLRGFRVELGEIENRLVSHPAVDMAVAVVRGDMADAHIVGYVTASAPVTSVELRTHVGQALPAHMVPTKIIVLDRFPTQANGKIDRSALPAPEARSSDPQRQDKMESGDSSVAIICKLVRDILAVPQAHPTDNFFELGGHSIQVTRLAGHIREELNIRLPIRTVLESATLGELATAVDRLRAGVA
ncbi:non-ribosomal peptide synthetase [Micromonospora sp. R77]|uniref:non-ribosomal peptide synthetase n=1 Tax=Micromonospora sp. R77 TaxID=2925836 RepID=UPI001F62231B|nr:non-ribosomal peptide synthetase [Micromonospora sp. R77]MCI4061486.1 non-ribosomal peptide synthetase [Micromonospora sp. R77]